VVADAKSCSWWLKGQVDCRARIVRLRGREGHRLVATHCNGRDTNGRLVTSYERLADKTDIRVCGRAVGLRC
jgi:hypothetical protein